jgi:hypothetical protein
MIHHADGTNETIVPANQDFVSHVSLIGGQIWMLCEKGKSVQIWDAESKSLLKSYGGPDVFGRGV